MRDFGSACGDSVLQMAIAELDASGFADDAAGLWKGEPLWLAFTGCHKVPSLSEIVTMSRRAFSIDFWIATGTSLAISVFFYFLIATTLLGI